MPAWGAIDGRIGNNPFVLAVPDQNGEHVVVDTAMAQYSYGKLSVCRQNGEKLPYPGGYDEEGSLTCDPAAIEKTRRRTSRSATGKVLGLSIVLDLIGGILTLGRTVTKVGQECESEYGLTQVFIAIRPEVLNQDPDKAQEIVKRDTERYPGFHSGKRRTYRPISRTGNTHPTQGKSEERNPGQRGNMEKDM